MDEILGAPTTAPTLAPTAAPFVAPDPAAAQNSAPDATAAQNVASGVPVSTKPRQMDKIHEELLAAESKHEAAVVALQESKQTIGRLMAEYKDAMTWFSQEILKIEAGVDDAESWIEKLVKKL